MKTVQRLLGAALLLLALQTTAQAQSADVSEIFKQHFNQTAQAVKSTSDPVEQRALLNDSFSKMLETIDYISSNSNLTPDEEAQLASLKNTISEKKDELNGQNGFDEIADEDLVDYTDYSQQSMEQANRNITLSLTAALLIILIIILLV
jgi:hypothetical protein